VTLLTVNILKDEITEVIVGYFALYHCMRIMLTNVHMYVTLQLVAELQVLCNH
jgi:hypothetical protein